MLFATAGVHPHHATDLTPDSPARPRRHWRATPDVVAVGECGLDYFRDLSPRDLQRRAFGWQLEIAAPVGKPVFLHQRDAHDDFIAILREHGVTRGVAHCFTGAEKERDAYLELGLHIGITGWINDERRGLHLREVVKGIPADRLHARNRRSLSTAARYQAGAEDTPQRARLPAVRGARDRGGAW